MIRLSKLLNLKKNYIYCNIGSVGIFYRYSSLSINWYNMVKFDDENCFKRNVFFKKFL